MSKHILFFNNTAKLTIFITELEKEILIEHKADGKIHVKDCHLTHGWQCSVYMLYHDDPRPYHVRFPNGMEMMITREMRASLDYPNNYGPK